MMNVKEFKKNVDLYSADLSLWPGDLLRPALSVVDANAEARAYLDAAVVTEERLRFYQPALPDMLRIEDRVMAAIATIPQEMSAAMASPVTGIFSRPAWIFAPGGGLMAAVIIGFFMGMNPAPQSKALLDSSFYSTEQITHGNDTIYNGEIL